MTVHPEDAMAYAEQLHVDLTALVHAVNSLSGLLAMACETIERDVDGEAAIRVARKPARGARPRTRWTP